MKKILLVLAFVISFGSILGQSNKEIAGVYIKKAEANYSNLEIDQAAKNFKKAIKLLDTIVKSDIARLGTLIQFELNEFAIAKRYAKQYFVLVKNKKTEEYSQLLDLYVTIDEELEKIELENVRKEKERLAREKEARRIDSLKNVWQQKSDAMSLKITSILKFDKNNTAVFSKGEYFGIMDHKGMVIVEADEYKSSYSFDGYILLSNQKNEATKIYCYNTKIKKGSVLPNISEFNTLSTHYGNIMMPRGNGVIVTYPNNSLKSFVYNVNTQKFIKIEDEKSLFKELKKTDKIDKYNKEGQVKIDKEWYNFGGHIGGGVYPLFKDNYSLYGFLCGIDGKVLTTDNYKGLGTFHNNKFHVVNGADSYWINQNGTKVDAPINESGKYSGVSKVVALDNGSFQIHQIIEGKKYIILGEEKLEMLQDFLRKHP